MLIVIVTLMARIFAILIVLLLLYQMTIRILAKTLRRYVAVPAPAFLGKLLDSRFRKKIQPPRVVILRSGIKQGMRVVDLGCGSGTFTFEIARHAGDKGEVFAIDIQPKMLRQLKSKLTREENTSPRKRIRVIGGSAYGIPLKDESVDVCCMVSVLQEIPDREKALREVKRILKPKGILAVTEFVIDPDYALSTTTIKLGIKAGFAVDAVLGNFGNYTVRFRKEASKRRG